MVLLTVLVDAADAVLGGMAVGCELVLLVSRDNGLAQGEEGEDEVGSVESTGMRLHVPTPGGEGDAEGVPESPPTLPFPPAPRALIVTAPAAALQFAGSREEEVDEGGRYPGGAFPSLVLMTPL